MSTYVVILSHTDNGRDPAESLVVEEFDALETALEFAQESSEKWEAVLVMSDCDGRLTVIQRYRDGEPLSCGFPAS